MDGRWGGAAAWIKQVIDLGRRGAGQTDTLSLCAVCCDLRKRAKVSVSRLRAARVGLALSSFAARSQRSGEIKRVPFGRPR